MTFISCANLGHPVRKIWIVLPGIILKLVLGATSTPELHLIPEGLADLALGTCVVFGLPTWASKSLLLDLHCDQFKWCPAKPAFVRFPATQTYISTNCHWLGLPRTIQSFCQVSGSPVTDKARLGLVSLVFPKSLCKNLGDLWYILRLLKQILQSLNPKPSSPFRWTQKRQLHQQRWQGKAGVWSGVFTVFIPLVFKLFWWRIPSDSLGIQAVKNSITNETAWNRAATMQALGPCEVKAEGHTFGDGWPTCVGISTCHSFTHIKRWASHITIYTKGDTALHLQSATYTKCCQIRKNVLHKTWCTTLFQNNSSQTIVSKPHFQTQLWLKPPLQRQNQTPCPIAVLHCQPQDFTVRAAVVVWETMAKRVLVAEAKRRVKKVLEKRLSSLLLL